MTPRRRRVRWDDRANTAWYLFSTTISSERRSSVRSSASMWSAGVIGHLQGKHLGDSATGAVQRDLGGAR